MTRDTLIKAIQNTDKRFPGIRDSLREIYSDALDEIDSGASESNQVSLAIDDIKTLVSDLFAEDYNPSEELV